MLVRSQQLLAIAVVILFVLNFVLFFSFVTQVCGLLGALPRAMLFSQGVSAEPEHTHVGHC